jgi:UDPglucose 6-dehydrogenase
MKSFLIVGKGTCGTATAAIFNDQVDYQDPDKGYIITDCSQYCYAFICVPTPGLAGSTYNYKYVEDSFIHLLKHGFQGTAVIRSTCDPSFLQRMSEVYEKTIYWPEFLREAHAVHDAKHPDNVVIGGELTLVDQLVDTLHKAGHERMTLWTKTDLLTASIIKLSLNSALASKISMFNSIHNICKSTGADWETVRTVVGNDTRIGIDHTEVPGPDGKFGFGGKCLPKDLISFSQMAKENVYLDSIMLYNKQIRE